MITDFCQWSFAKRFVTERNRVLFFLESTGIFLLKMAVKFDHKKKRPPDEEVAEIWRKWCLLVAFHSTEQLATRCLAGGNGSDHIIEDAVRCDGENHIVDGTAGIRH